MTFQAVQKTGDDTRLYHTDHLGSTALVTDLDGEVTQNVAYIPYGEVFVEQRNGTWNTPYLFNAKELDEETGLYYYGARYLDPTGTRWLSVDPLFEKYVGMTPYGYCEGNPVRFVDPNGKSTHTSEDGTVIAVNNDGDLGVYKHKKDETNTAKYKFKELNVKKNYEFSKVFYDGEKMGETEYWDEFINPETNKVFDGIKIKFGEDFMPTIENMHKKSLDMNLAEIAKESSPTGLFDIKLKLGNVGALLNGKYATSRSAGNFLAGYNAESGRLMGVSITYETFQKLSGALHIESSRHKKLSKSQMAQIVLRGKYSGCSDEKSFNTPPTYGEVQYQYRMSVMGWNYGKKKR